MKRLLPFILLAVSAITAHAQTVTFSVPVAPCNNNGVLTATFTGLTPPLTVVWATEGTTSTTIVHTATGLSDALTGYSGGPVSITVSDGTAITSSTFAGAAPLSYAVTATEAICPSLGTIAGTASGGTAPYTYQWMDKATGSIIATANPASLPTGDYGVIVTDAAGCKYGSTVKTDTNRILYTSFTATLTATTANCTDGTASVSAISAAAVLPVSYLWNNGATTPALSGLSTGNYTVEIIDALGCKATTDTAMPYNPYSVFVGQLSTVSVPFTATPATCTAADGAIATFATGGTAPYTYSWSNGAVSASQTGLAAGAYSVTVVDANGCRGQNNVLIGAASPIAVSSSSSPSLCTSPTGNASIIPAGGTLPYSIKWYTSPAQTSATATLLAPGTYTYEVKDGAGCIQKGTVNVPPVNVVTATFTSTSPMCAAADGSINALPAGGVAPYTYLWNNGSTTQTVLGIAAGNYEVSITDNVGCKVKAPITLSSFSPVGVGLSVVQASCVLANDGMATATAYGGTAPYSYGWSTGGTTPTISSLPTGHYKMTVTDAAGCTTGKNLYVGYDAAETSCYCTIEGTVYNDTNSNCTQDAGEIGIVNAQVYCSGIGYTYTDAKGHYSFMVPSGSYTVTETVSPIYPLTACQTNNIAVTAIAAAGCTHTVDFANIGFPVHSLRISAATIVPPVPGKQMVQRITVVNEGTVLEDSVYTVHTTSGQLFAPMFTPSGIFSGSPYTYSTSGFPAILPGANQAFTVTYNVPANAAAGTVVTFNDTVGWNAPISTWADDYRPANNVRNHSATIVSSYDANYKEVYPKGTGTNGIIYATDTTLEYTVHFQNTGSDYVQHIEIVDTLDSDLEWASLQPVYASHPCDIKVYQTGALKVVKFTFENANLPTKTMDDLRSNGLVTYSIKTMPGLALGTQFRNSASIYFDYHAPIKTNTTLNTLGSTGPTKVNNNATQTNTVNEFTVYPNPANTQFFAVVNSEKATTAFMTITDVSGKTMTNRTIQLLAGAQTIATDINQYASGMYFVNINANGKVYTQKLVVIK